MKQPIELRRLRDFGQIINDSFTFLKENFKPLFKALLIICGFFILISFISMVFTYLNITNIFTRFNLDSKSYDSTYKPSSIILAAFVSAFVLVLTQSFITLVTLCYISVYLQKGNSTPDLAEVWGYFKYYFWRVLGSGILISLLFMIGLVLCVIPGIYLFPILYLIIPIIVIENCSFGYAFNKSFRLIKNNWWLVFGVIFIMSLIVGVAGSIVNIPITLFRKGGMFFSFKTFTLPVVVVFSLFRSILLLAYVLPSIGIALCYFNLAEEKDGTGLLDRIEKLGKPNNESNLPTEEY
ncbi:MAG TPA: hypothetical protein VGN20_20125 [Mucilaginibacter sp.]|jgi:hypothetical protein